MSQDQTRMEFEQEVRIKALKDSNFRQRLLDNPKAAIKGMTDAPKTEDVKYEVSVYEETANTIYLVIPGEQYVNAHNELSEAELEAVAGGGFWKDFGQGFRSGFFSLTTCTPNL